LSRFVRIDTIEDAFGRILYSSSSTLASKEIGFDLEASVGGTNIEANGDPAVVVIVSLPTLYSDNRIVLLPLNAKSKYTPFKISKFLSPYGFTYLGMIPLYEPCPEMTSIDQRTV
jgi:hypothetical protein